MTREIKFKAWDKKRRIFIASDLLFVFANCALYYQREREIELRDGLQNPYLADPKNELEMDLIFLQYSGLKDKNGTKIFEGDIVEVRNVGLCEVVFENGAFLIRKPSFSGLLYHYILECEVVGNIYRNPELLGQKYE